MYDISQLNDLLVPELIDIADQLNIPSTKKMARQELISLILEKQAAMTKDNKTPDGEKPKRKRILKTDSAEPAKSTPAPKEEVAKKEITKPKKAEPEKKVPVKKQQEEIEEEEEDLQPITDQDSTIPAAIAQMLQEEDIQQPEVDMEEPVKQGKEQRTFQQQRRDQPSSNIELYGGVLGEDVLEMVPDG